MSRSFRSLLSKEHYPSHLHCTIIRVKKAGVHRETVLLKNPTRQTCRVLFDDSTARAVEYLWRESFANFPTRAFISIYKTLNI